MIETVESLLLQAIRRFAEHGFDSQQDLEKWLIALHAAIERELPTDSEMRRNLVLSLQKIYARDIDRLGLRKLVPGVNRYTIENVRPHLLAELDRRISGGR